ncbi:MAG: hypothetical protein JWO08_1019 [Verrucomicrobiaceae bacterium]|nr:hypothetical protein [Verrucomicrobiaceae bacterium]
MNRAQKLLANLAFLGAASSAFSATVIHITGSTAYRSQTNTAILKSFDNGTTVKVGSTNAALGSSAVSYFHGTMGGVDTIIETKFTGSVGGIKAVTSGALLEFLADDTDTRGGNFSTVNIVASSSPTVPSFGSTVGANGLCQTPGGTNPSVNSVAAEVTMSDTFQDATQYRSPTLTGAVIPGAPPAKVGVVPFVWIRTPSAAANVSALNNMNPTLANLLYGNGTLPLAMWSGLASDESYLVYGAGRDPDSGTRLSTFAESGRGANSTVRQYHPLTEDTTATSISQAGSINSVEVFPTTTVANLGQTFINGNAGESSGGTLAGYMAKGFATANPGALVAYSGTGDASGAIQKGAQILAWNGVSLATQPALGTTPAFDFNLIRNGKYTFWSYEHMLYLSGISADKKTVANKIATQIYTTDAQILISSMRVDRAGDGAQVTPVY